MKKIFKWSTVFIFALILYGCGGTVDIRENTVTEVLVVPSTLTTDVKVEPPPSVYDYVGLTPIEKEDVLINLFREQTKNLEEANTKFKLIRDWIKDQLDLYQKKKD